MEGSHRAALIHRGAVGGQEVVVPVLSGKFTRTEARGFGWWRLLNCGNLRVV